MLKSLTRPVLALATLATIFAARPADADTVYVSKGAFLAATAPGYYLETFDSLEPWPADPYASPMSFSDGTFSYDASADGGIYPITDPTDDSDVWFGPNFATDSLVFTMTGAPVKAIGGNFFVTDALGEVISGTITALLDNGQFLSVVTDSDVNFIGFTTTNAIVSLTITVEQTGDPTNGPFSWATVNDFIVGTTPNVVVPEPATIAMVLPALLVGGALVARRRNARS